MFCSWRRRVLFVHVQKTGGSTVDVLMRAADPGADKITDVRGRRHATLRSALRVHPELEDFFVFGFVRNPWARLLSWYRMVERRRTAAERAASVGDHGLADRMHNHTFWRRAAYDYADFEEFVLRGTREIHRLQVPQLDYLRTARRRADFIGRHERFETDLREAFRRAGLPAPPDLPHHNAGPPTAYRDHYDPAMRERVAAVCSVDIDEFGYTF